MDWITELLAPGNESIAATLVLYSFVIAAGIYIGKLKVCGISLGVTFVLFVGILMGHFGYTVNAEILKFVREFGLILFIFAISPGRSRFLLLFQERRREIERTGSDGDSSQRGYSTRCIFLR